MTGPLQNPAQIPHPSPREVSFQVSLLCLLYQNSDVCRQISELEQLRETAPAVSVPA
jgi:hypothetical protein